MLYKVFVSRWLLAGLSMLLLAALKACGGGGGGNGSGAGETTATGSAVASSNAGDDEDAEDLTASSGDGFLKFGSGFGSGGFSAAKAALIISEVAFNAGFIDDSAWFEVYDPGTVTINLRAFKLRSTSANVSTSSRGSQTFNLPSVEIPAKGYFVLAGKTIAELPNGPKLRYLNNGADVPG